MKRKAQPREPFDVKGAIRERRERRMHRNLAHEQQVRQRAAQHGLSLEVHNDGHHWVFRKAGLVAEWWPSSAKLVVNRDYRYDLHVHDWPQVLDTLLKVQAERASPSQKVNLL